MKLAAFISNHLDQILEEWVSFARTQAPAGAHMTTLALQDHAKQILQAIVLDIEAQQNPSQAHAKSQGRAGDSLNSPSAAAIHGTLRYASDFSLLQLSAEFRALRASVLRLWLLQVEQMNQDAARDMVRFNEAIDQALAESIATYSAQSEQSRELFLAILGHDLRAPLSTMSLAGNVLQRPDLPPAQVVTMGARVQRSASLMNKMVNDLLGFTRTQLGGGMPMHPAPADLAAVCRGALDDAQAGSPVAFEFTSDGDLSGTFDAVRMHQLLTNLLANAGQYGAKDRPVVMRATRDHATWVVTVTNQGAPIPPALRESIFRPLIQLPVEGEEDTRPRTSLGLGLFVAREIAVAHGGSIEVASDEDQGTTFTVRLPVRP